MKKALGLALSMALSGAAFAQQTSTTSLKSFYDQLKESPLSFSYYGDVSTAKSGKDRDYKVDAMDMAQLFTLGYKISDNDSLKVVHRVDTNGLFSYDNSDSETSWIRTELKYGRANILTEEANGVGLSFAVELRYLGSQYRASTNRYGHLRLGPTFSKSLTDSFSVSTSLLYAQKLRKNGAANVTSHYYYPIVGMSYAVNDKVSINLLTEYVSTKLKDPNATSDKGQDIVTLTPSVGYTFNESVSAGLYMSQDIAQSGDGKGYCIRKERYCLTEIKVEDVIHKLRMMGFIAP